MNPAIVNAKIYKFRLPLIRPVNLGPLTISEREGLLLRIEDDGGNVGWGEASPLPGFSNETLEDTDRALVLTAKRLLADQQAVPFYPEITPAATHALCGSLLGIHPEGLASLSFPAMLQVAALLTGNEEEIVSRAKTAASLGYRAAKLKVGRLPVEADILLVGQVRRALGRDCRLRLDANRAWTLDTCRKFLTGILGEMANELAPLDYLEEPLSDITNIDIIRREFGMPIALDESLIETANQSTFQFMEDPPAAVDAWIWKPSCWTPMLTRPEHGVSRLILSAAFESGVGTALIARYAFEQESLEPAGLDTYSYLAEDVLEERLPLNQPEVEVRTLVELARRVDVSKLELLHEFTR